jgi:hypothetical protein
MEPLWSPVVATAGNQWRIDNGAKPLKQAKTVAVGCDQLPKRAHGKEGVSGSSPEEGSAKAPHSGAFPFRSTCRTSNVQWVWSLGWSLQVTVRNHIRAILLQLGCHSQLEALAEARRAESSRPNNART